MAGGVSGTDAWLAARTTGAPEVLRERVEAWAALADPAQPVPERLAAAGQAALEAAIRSGQERPVALDLLAADALVTLALLAQAETAPGRLGMVARAIRLGEGGQA